MDNSSKLHDAMEKAVSRMAGNLEATMEEYPFMNKVAAQKWLYLKSHGYVSDRRYDKGLIFYNQERPHIWGYFSWWGEVNWTKET